MNGYEYLKELFESEQIEKPDRSEELYKVIRARGGYDDETVLIRFVQPNDDIDEIMAEDNRTLEILFYNEDTPNRWNIQLFWACHEKTEIDETTRTNFESNTRFAIRRCVSVDSLGAFLRPLQTVEEDLKGIDIEFDRGELIEEIINKNLGFLFDIESTNREGRLKELKSGSGPSAESIEHSQTVGPQGIIETINLGSQFRQPAKHRTLETEPFTLLYGPNGTGKTSLLDAAALGMVGQIRDRNTQRSHEYENLCVTLTGTEEGPVKLSNDPSAVSDRISNWYGFRPRGRADRYIEFYHVNYYESGSTTRLADPDTNLDLETTIRRLVYGEQLWDARKEKQELVKEAGKRVESIEEQIEQREEARTELEEKLQRAEKLFSKAQKSRDELSPVLQSLIPVPPTKRDLDDDANQEHEQWIEVWTTWSERLQRLHEGLEKAGITAETTSTPAALSTALSNKIEETEKKITRLYEVERGQRDATEIQQLHNNLKTTKWGESPPTVALVATTLSLHGFEGKDLQRIAKTKDAGAPVPDDTIEEWRNRLQNSLENQLSELTEKRDTILEINDLQAKREELLDEIRERTEEYLDITEQVEYCPACYIEQTEGEIRSRHRPPDILASDVGVSEQLEADIKGLKEVINILERPEWSEVAYNLETRFSEVYTEEDLRGTLQSFVSDGDVKLPKITEKQLTRFVAIIRDEEAGSDRGQSAATILKSARDALDAELKEMKRSATSPDTSIDDVAQFISQLETRKDQLVAARDVIEEHIPDDVRKDEFRVEKDRRVLQSMESELQDEPVAVESVSHLDQRIHDTEEEMEVLAREKDGFEDGITRLNTVFERSGGNEEFTAYLREHMSAITTLFKAFQRPYQFKRVLLDEEDKVRVVRRRADDLDKADPISEMSSGQRAALALAIFVTNNLAHEQAPPVMLLDEPFAHLDDINTISFFNLLIELATRQRNGQDRQVIFATANVNLADLLKRKIGESPKFRRITVGE